MEQTSRYRLHFAFLAAIFLAGFSVSALAEGAGIATIDGEPVSYEEFERRLPSLSVDHEIIFY